MFSSLRDTTLRENNNNNNTSTLFPRHYFLQNNTNNSIIIIITNCFHGKYLTRNITKKIKIRNNTNVGGDENSSYQSNEEDLMKINKERQRTKNIKRITINILGNSSSKIVSLTFHRKRKEKKEQKT